VCTQRMNRNEMEVLAEVLQHIHLHIEDKNGDQFWWYIIKDRILDVNFSHCLAYVRHTT